jgi:hypothetical protein
VALAFLPDTTGSAPAGLLSRKHEEERITAIQPQAELLLATHRDTNRVYPEHGSYLGP